VDVPNNAVFLDEIIASDTGLGALALPHAVPLYERDGGFVTDRTVLGREQFRDLSPGRQWVVESTTRKNALGKSTAYAIRPTDSILTYSAPDFAPLQHAQFAQHQLWVTRYRDGELYATGDYPNQGPAGEGLPRYIADRDKVDGDDLVVWYTTGLTHVPTVEEYPVMTTDTVGFSLRPNGFFDQNPALDAP
jgi:primary-amine oxidase